MELNVGDGEDEEAEGEEEAPGEHAEGAEGAEGCEVGLFQQIPGSHQAEGEASWDKSADADPWEWGGENADLP